MACSLGYIIYRSEEWEELDYYKGLYLIWVNFIIFYFSSKHNSLWFNFKYELIYFLKFTLCSVESIDILIFYYFSGWITNLIIATYFFFFIFFITRKPASNKHIPISFGNTLKSPKIIYASLFAGFKSIWFLSSSPLDFRSTIFLSSAFTLSIIFSISSI